MRALSEAILCMENITKVYPNGFVANKDVNFSVNKGEIHALAGENGAGKSTLMKVLFGAEIPDEGRILYKGEEIEIGNPSHAIELGIGMVHQHFMLVPSLTVTENIVMGAEPKKGFFIDYAKAEKMTREVCEKYNFEMELSAKVKDLPVGVKQKIEILKALLRGAEVLILDEPTAVLTPQETHELFIQLKNLREAGHTIIFISHKLHEIKEICDRITILRGGRTVCRSLVADVSEQDISRKMVGRDVVLEVAKTPAKPKEPVLKIRNLTLKDNFGKTVLNNISLSVRKGEILGIAGVEGNGQREIAETVTGLSRYGSGTILIGSQDIKKCSIREIRALKVSHIPEDRMAYGIAADESIQDNMISDRYHLPAYNRHGLMNFDKIKAEVDQNIKDYLVKCDDRSQPVRTLSGGNIQKVVAAREFSSGSELAVVNQPTRGIDVGATEFVRRRIVELRDQGTAVVLISADLNEVMELSDSLIVMCDGKITAYFPDSSRVTEEELGEYMLGIKKMSPEETEKIVYE